MKVITIGRLKDNNNVVIEDNKVSRSHLQIIKDDNGDYYVIDLDSTNGTYVNGNRITGKVQLHKGDTIVIGYTTLSWETYFGSDDSDEDGKEPGTSNKKLYIVIFSILICVFIGVIAIITYNNKKNEQYREASNKVTQAYSEETKKANEAKDVAEKEAIRAKEQESAAKEEARVAEEAKQKAEEQAKREVNAANIKAEEAKEAAEKAQEEVIAANKKVADAQNAANEAKAEAEKEVLEANKKVADAQNAANEAKAEAEESEQLTEEFYELLSSLNSAKIKSVCEDMELKSKDKETLKSHFKNANNEGKKKVIKSIKNVKNISEPTEEQIQQPSGMEQATEQENENIE